MTRRRVLPWMSMAAILAVTLAVGARSEGGPETVEARVERMASEIRCPACRGLSAADSDAPPARAIREELRRRVLQGESDEEAMAYIVSRYGKDALLRPEGRGVSAVVWAAPVAVALCALAGVALAFRRWRSRPARPVSDADRALVEEAMRS